jgi:Bacterial membrane protein YfhO
MSLLVYLAGGAVIAVLVRWWRPRLGWGWIAGYWLLAGVFFAAPLTTSAVQVPVDLVYGLLPWSEMEAGPAVPGNALLSDVPVQMIPFRALVRDRLLRLEPPLWAPEMGTGQPLLGNAQSAPFSPLGLLALPLPPVRALPVMAALRLFLSLLLTDVLLTALGAGRAGAVLAALAFTFSVFSICWAYHPHGMAMAWLPGVILGLVLTRGGGRGGTAGLVACASGMALSGHPETLAHVALAATLVAAALAVAPSAAASRRRFLASLLLAAAITAGLTAPVLLPVVEALPESIRSLMLVNSPGFMQPPPFAAPTLRVLVDPLAYGSPRDGDWNGPWNYNELCSGYAGLLALALAGAAAVMVRGRTLAILGGGAAALAAAFALPPFLGLVRSLPLFAHAANGRLRLFWVLAVTIVAGLGLEPLAARRSGRWAAGLASAAAAAALALDGQPRAPWQRAWWLATLATCCLAALAFLWLAAHTSLRLERWACRGLPWLAVACLALDLGLLEARFLPVIAARFDLAPPPAVAVLAREMRARPEAPFRVIARGTDLLPNLAAFYGLWDARGADPMEPGRAAAVAGVGLLPRLGPERRPVPGGRAFRSEFLRYLAVRYLLTAHREVPPPPWVRSWDGVGGSLWQDPAALPLFFMPATWRPAADPRQAVAATLDNRDFAAAAVAEMPEPAAEGAAPARRQQGAVRIRRAAANGFEVDIASPTGGLAVSSVAFTRGWRLAIDGLPGSPLRVNGAFIGFLVPAGSHHAALEYRPAGWTWGLRLCGLTLIALLALGALPASRRRRGTEAERGEARSP